MKRSRLKRRTPLKRRNEERAARLRAEQFGVQAELCRWLPCLACGRKPPSDPEHYKTRAAGGKDQHTVPLCRTCHNERHQIGIQTFQAKHQVDLPAYAAMLGRIIEQVETTYGEPVLDRLLAEERKARARVPKPLGA